MLKINCNQEYNKSFFEKIKSTITLYIIPLKL